MSTASFRAQPAPFERNEHHHQANVAWATRRDRGRSASRALSDGRPLSATQRRRLAHDIVDGESAITEMTAANMGIVRMWVRRYSAVLAHLSYGELEEVARDGILQAVHDWEPEKGSSFSSWASFRVRSRLQRLVVSMYGAAWAPKVLIVQRSRRKLENEHGRPISIEEISTDIGLTAERVAVIDDHMKSCQQRARSVRLDSGDEFQRHRLEYQAVTRTSHLAGSSSDPLHDLVVAAGSQLTARQQQLVKFVLIRDDDVSLDDRLRQYARRLEVPVGEVYEELDTLRETLSRRDDAGDGGGVR